MKAFITRKIGMTSAIAQNGSIEAITLLSASDNVVTQIKNSEIDGYDAVQIGMENHKNPAKPQVGHNKSAKVTPKVSKEFKNQDPEEVLNVGDVLSVDVFSVGDMVDVTALTKGKGWAGTIKRHNFSRGRKTHGGRSYRRPGSIGSMYPQKIFKGKRMAGQMGHIQATVKNLRVALVDKDLGVIGVSGAVPGPNKGIVTIRGKK